MKNLASVYLAAGLILTCAGTVHATLLADHFGVTPTLDSGHFDPKQGTTTYAFDLNSLTPGLHVGTVDYVIDDWYGYWSKTDLNDYVTIRGTHPYGDEPYDVEAVYFDDDADNLYIAIITSFDPPPGIYDSRLGATPLISTGDLALDFGLNPVTVDGFRYDYGVNINNEIRPPKGGALDGGSAIDNRLYRTANGDWYAGSPKHSPSGHEELTNIDPNWGTFSGIYLGDVTVDYYDYVFAGGLLECGTATRVIEVTIPKSLLIGGLNVGDQVGIHWTEGCRNDILRGIGIINVPEPSVIVLLAVGGLVIVRRRK